MRSVARRRAWRLVIESQWREISYGRNARITGSIIVIWGMVHLGEASIKIISRLAAAVARLFGWRARSKSWQCQKAISRSSWRGYRPWYLSRGHEIKGLFRKCFSGGHAPRNVLLVSRPIIKYKHRRNQVNLRRNFACSVNIYIISAWSGSVKLAKIAKRISKSSNGRRIPWNVSNN